MQKEEKIVRGADLATTGQKIKSYVQEQIADKQDAIDTVNVSVDNTTGTPSASASISGGIMNFAFSGIKGATGPQGPKGDPGNTGSSVDYPYELVNNVTTDDATKGLSAAQGKVLDEKISQLGLEKTGLRVVDAIATGLAYQRDRYYNAWTSGNITATGVDYAVYTIPNIGIQRIEATLAFSDSNSVAIAFYSTEMPSTEGYLQSKSVRGSSAITSYSANVPDECRCIVITNKESVQSSPKITAYLGSETLDNRNNLELLDGLDTDICTIAEKTYIKQDTGVATPSASFTAYKIRNFGIKYIRATLGFSDTGVAAIAFYSTDEVSSASYMLDYRIRSIAGSRYKWEAVVPDGCKLIVITNRQATLSTPSISLYSLLDKECFNKAICP